MPIVRTYECGNCGGSFDELHMRRDEPPPAFCKLCGHSTAPQQAVTAPNINSAHAKVIDGTVQAIDEGAQFRSEKVREMTGEVVDMRLPHQDLKPGEAIKFDTSTPVHQFMEKNAQSTPIGYQQQSNVAEFVRSVKAAPDSGGALRLMKSMTSEHALRAGMVQKAGQQNK